MTLDLRHAAAKAIGATGPDAVTVVKVSTPPYPGRHYEVTNLHTGTVVYFDLDAHADEPATPDPEPTPEAIDLDDHTVAELKGIARRLDVSVTGTKAALIERIQEALEGADE